MKKVLFLIAVATSLLCFSCYTYQPAINYSGQPSPYTLEITFNGGVKDTIYNVRNFKSYCNWDGSVIMYKIETCNNPHPQQRYTKLICKSIELQNVNLVKILNN